MGHALLSKENPLLAESIDNRSTLIVTTPTVYHLYGERLLSYLRHQAVSTTSLQVVNCTEPTKTLQTVERVCQLAEASAIDRQGLLIGFGGGVCTDIVTVAASWIRRGISHLRIPTTLIGQIDAAIGIKGAVNFGARKNYLGCYYMPEEVLVDPTFLSSLPERHLRCGLAEMVKMAIIRDPELFQLIESFQSRLLETRFVEPATVMETVIAQSISQMLEELEPNLFENKTYRRLVDFGHTFSPLLESTSEFKIAHGEAVAIDMAASASIAMQLGLLSSVDCRRILKILSAIGLPLWSPLLTLELATQALKEARCHRGGTTNFVAPVGIGEATFLDLRSGQIANLLQNAINSLQDMSRQQFLALDNCSLTSIGAVV